MNRNCGCNLCASNRSTLGPTGEYAHVEGFLTIAKGFASHAQGAGVCNINATLTEAAGGPMKDISGRTGAVFNSACGSASHVQGCGTVATGDHSHAQGVGTQAVGSGSHAQGLNTKASGISAHSQGTQTLAQGDHSHAKGLRTFAKGFASTASGCDTCALGAHSTADGIESIARNYGQVAYSTGKFECKGDNQCSLFTVRNEIEPGITDRLYLDGEIEQITVPCNSIWKFDILCLGRSVSIEEWCCFEFRGVLQIDSHGDGSIESWFSDFNCQGGSGGLNKDSVTINFGYDPDLDEWILYLNVTNDSTHTYRFFAHINTYEITVPQKKCDKKCGCLRKMQKPCDTCC